MDLEQLCYQVKEVTINTGTYIRENLSEISAEKINSKGIHDFVTYVDQIAEKMLVEKISMIFPDSGFIVEEKTIDKIHSKYNWIIDPLDGTTNYIHGLAPFAVSVALKEDDEIILGIVYEIGLDECFYAWKNSKAYLNDEIITVSNARRISDSLVATGFPYYDYERISPFLETLKYFMENSHGIRRLGSAATDLAYVACGRFEAFYEYSLSPWDVAAGSLIVKQAGGKVCDFSRGNNFLFGKEIIATNNEIHDAFVHAIDNIMNTEK